MDWIVADAMASPILYGLVAWVAMSSMMARDVAGPPATMPTSRSPRASAERRGPAGGDDKVGEAFV